MWLLSQSQPSTIIASLSISLSLSHVSFARVATPHINTNLQPINKYLEVKVWYFPPFVETHFPLKMKLINEQFSSSVLDLIFLIFLISHRINGSSIRVHESVHLAKFCEVCCNLRCTCAGFVKYRSTTQDIVKRSCLLAFVFVCFVIHVFCSSVNSIIVDSYEDFDCVKGSQSIQGQISYAFFFSLNRQLHARVRPRK